MHNEKDAKHVTLPFDPMNQPRVHTGCDVVFVPRIARESANSIFLEKTFHRSEYDNADAKSLAGIFALKEATMKALGLNNDTWLEIEVCATASGKPELKLSTSVRPNDLLSIDCSISHDGDYAFAVVTALTQG